MNTSAAAPINQLVDPYKKTPIRAYPLESFSSANARIDDARTAQQRWQHLPIAQRRELFLNALRYIEHNLDGYASRISDEMFKPLRQARGELEAGLGKLRRIADMAEGALHDTTVAANGQPFAYTMRRVAKGLIYTIAPWNYPFFTALNSIGPALLAGNAVVLKHASTPSVGELFERAFNTMGGISGLCQHLSIDIPTSNRVILESAIDHVVFTGSVAGGAAMAQLVGQRASNLTLREPFLQTSLELGGSDAAYVAADADPVKAAQMLISVGRLHNSGQSCCATKRLFLHQQIAPAFLVEARALMEKQVPGSPHDPATTMGPLFGGPRAVEGLMAMVTDAVAAGATVLSGGKVVEKDGYSFILPTLITGVNLQMKIMREEAFGPILPVMVVANDDDALAHINHALFGLTTSVFTDNAALQDRVIDTARSGTVFINWCNDVHAEVAWSGWGHSGNGMPALSDLGFEALTRTQSIVRALA
ncbi:MAG: hypothetical protein B7Y51_00615 [Burkholderiales bacterium 28-67-8]|nr:MAG: hypothetical protein B7Y51_00615 [Burkholderiales bacterium 28-67-8]